MISLESWESGDDIRHQLPMDVRKSKITTRMVVGESLMVESHEMKNRGMPVMDVDTTIHCLGPVFIGRTVLDSSLDAAAGHPHRESLCVVIPSIVVLGIGRAAEFSAAENESVLEHSTLLEISQETRDRPVDLGATADHRLSKVAMMIPSAGGDLYETAHRILQAASP